MTPRVYFDESGNTGEDLINRADPVFTLSSCSFSSEQEAELLHIFRTYQGRELKYATLRRSVPGRRSVIEFLKHPHVSSGTVALMPIHKDFMIVTKYCDLVLEPSMREAGVNFYQQGLNLATANLLTTILPVLVNPVTWANFLTLFVTLIRRRDKPSFDSWVKSAALVFDFLQGVDPKTAHFFLPVLQLDFDEFINSLNDAELDPLIPAYYVLVNHWGRALGRNYDVHADRSKVLAAERERLLALGNESIAPVVAGFDRRTMDFPLKVSDIIPVDSTEEKQVQLADVLAGALAGAMKALAKRAREEFEDEIRPLMVEKRLVVDAMWPDSEVDPVKLGTYDPTAHEKMDLPTHTASILGDWSRKHSRTRA
jgi:hypothetical protein